MNNILKSNIHILIIIAFSIVCYHFLWLNAYSMKWDMAEQYLPWRYFMGKSLQNFEIPFWNSFQLGGYPFYADPQSGFWYYPAMLIAFTFGYSMQIIELEFISLIIISGLGFYFLLRKLNVSALSSCIFSISYLASGFIVGNAQHITWIAAAAWLPWLFYHYTSIRKDIYNWGFIWFLIIIYLFVSNSYPAFVIVASYIIIIDQCILFFKTQNKITYLRDRIILISAVITFLLPILYSLSVSVGYFSRGDGVTLQKALQHPFTWQSLLSLFTPFASFKNPELFKTDISMSNAYIGLIPLITILFSIYNGQLRKNVSWLLLSVLFLTISFGDQLPFRTFLYEYIPGFNLFRFPSLFRLFFILSILIYTAKQFDIIDFYKRKNIALLSLCIIVFSSFIVCNYSAYYFFHWNSLEILAIEIDKSSFVQHILFQLSIHIILLIFLVFILIKRIPIKYFLIICCLDIFLSVRLNSMATIVLSTKTKDVDALISSAPKNFTTPLTHSLSNNIDQKYEYRWPLNWNMNCYYGQIAIDGYNPFVLKSFNTLSESELKDSVWKNSWYYFPDYLPKHIKVLNFSPSHCKFYIETNDSTSFAFAQNPYIGWKAFIDQAETPIHTINFAHQIITVPPGKHFVDWKFEDFTLKIIFITHLFIFCFLLILGTIKNISNLRIKH